MQSAAHPDANIIFGATFDDTMDDEIRVTVIATQFDEPPTNKSVEEQPAGVYSAAKVESARPAQVSGVQTGTAQAAPAAPVPMENPAPAPAEEDPFDKIFQIFSQK